MNVHELITKRQSEGEDLWNDQPKKKRQKDIDARWTQKGGQKYFGYKDHAKIDAKSKLIDTYEVTSAEVHDSQPTEKLLREGDKEQELYADSAYIGEPISEMLMLTLKIVTIQVIFLLLLHLFIVILPVESLDGLAPMEILILLIATIQVMFLLFMRL